MSKIAWEYCDSECTGIPVGPRTMKFPTQYVKVSKYTWRSILERIKTDIPNLFIACLKQISSYPRA
jgi:hypothetical protein